MWALFAVAAVAFLALRGSSSGLPSTPKCNFATKAAPLVAPGALDPGKVVHLACTDAQTGDSLDVSAVVVSYTSSADTVTVQLQRAVGAYQFGDRVAVGRDKIWSVE